MNAIVIGLWVVLVVIIAVGVIWVVRRPTEEPSQYRRRQNLVINFPDRRKPRDTPSDTLP